MQQVIRLWKADSDCSPASGRRLSREVPDRASSPAMTRQIQTDPPAPRQIGAVNWLGLWTLYRKEVRRFLKVTFQTVAVPVSMSLLYMLLFAVVFASRRGEVQGIPYIEFLAPGLILMGVLNNAFANSSSSILVSKVQGNAVDFLMPPLSPAELAAGFILGAATRGVAVGLATAAVLVWFIDLTPDHVWAVLYFGLSASLMLGMLGVIGGIWAEKFDHIAVVTFFITPLTFLSGTFYSVSVLPEPFETLSHFNPFFYMIDGFRYGFTGEADGNVMIGAISVLVINAILMAICYLILKSGWRLKS